MTNYFGMFTIEGDLAVSGIVRYHKEVGSDWPTVYKNLKDLAASNRDKYGEAMDTMVREMVYDALGFKTDFYI